MKSYIPDWKLPHGRFQPPSRDDLLAAGSALVRRSLASSTPPTASEPVHRAATVSSLAVRIVRVRVRVVRVELLEMLELKL